MHLFGKIHNWHNIYLENIQLDELPHLFHQQDCVYSGHLINNFLYKIVDDKRI